MYRLSSTVSPLFTLLPRGSHKSCIWWHATSTIFYDFGVLRSSNSTSQWKMSRMHVSSLSLSLYDSGMSLAAVYKGVARTIVEGVLVLSAREERVVSEQAAQWRHFWSWALEPACLSLGLELGRWVLSLLIRHVDENEERCWMEEADFETVTLVIAWMVNKSTLISHSSLRLFDRNIT